MTPEQAFGKLNKDIKGLTSGVASTSVSGSSIIFTMNDGSTQTITFPQPKDGASIIAVSTNENNQFVFSMSDGTEIVGGEVPTSSGVSKEYVDTELAKKANTSDIPSLDGYVTEEVLDTKGYLTSHQDISGKVDKVDGKSLIDDTEIVRLKGVENYDDTEIKTELTKKADVSDIPTKVSELQNDSKYQTDMDVAATLTPYAKSADVTREITDKVAEIVADAPEDFNTLKEMSDWIANHENDASAMNSAIQDNKSAIATLQTGKADKTEIPTVPTDVSAFTNDAGYLTEHQDISNLIEKEDVYETLKLGYINSGSIKDFLLSDAKVGTYVVAPDVTDMPFGKYWWRINVEKPKSNDTSFKATATLLGKNSAIYYMIYNSADKNFYNGWTKIAVTRVEDVNWTTVDISSNEENTSTGATLNYCIKNGICYMSILNIGFKTETQAIILGANSVPKSSSDYCWCPLVGVADPSYSVLVHPTIYGGLEHHVVRSTSLVYSGLFSYPVAET